MDELNKITIDLFFAPKCEEGFSENKLLILIVKRPFKKGIIVFAEVLPCHPKCNVVSGNSFSPIKEIR